MEPGRIVRLGLIVATVPWVLGGLWVGSAAALAPERQPFSFVGHGVVDCGTFEDDFTDFFNGTIAQYDIDPPSGKLSPKTPASVGTGNQPRGIAVTPDGKSAYVANQGLDNVSQYTIDSLTGALSPKTPQHVAAGDGPSGVAVAPDGKSAYVTNRFSNTVSQYNIDPPTGALSPKTPAAVATGSGPFDVAVTPDNTSAYVTNVDAGDNVSQYTINPP